MPDYLGKDKELWQFYSLEAKKEILTNLQKKGDLTTYAALYDATLKQDSSIRGNDNGFTLGDVAQFGGQTEELTQEEREELKQTFEDVKSEKIEDVSPKVFEKLGLDPNDPELNKTFRDSLYLDHPVAGNVLDEYDLPQYVLTLYMKTRESIAREEQAGSQDATADDERKTQGDDQKGNVVKNRPQPGDIVILAQTGSTDVNIDNLSIAHLTNNDDNIPTSLNFTITEPGSITLMDRIAAAKEHCGYENTNDVPYFLEIDFKGYKANVDDEDAGGETVTIAGPYVYQLGGVTFDLDINTSGAVYNFTGYENADISKLDYYYRTPKQFEIVGKTIRELLKDLETKWNKELGSQASKDGKKPDTVVIDLDNLIAKDTPKNEGEDGNTSDLFSNSLFKDNFKKEDFASRGFVVTGETQNETTENNEDTSETITAKDNLGNEVTVISKELAEPDPSQIKSKTIPQIETVTIKANKGQSFENILATVLSLSEDIFKRATRLEDPNDVNSKVLKDKAYTEWFNVSTDLIRDFNNYDKVRGEYVKTIKFIPKIIKESRSDIVISLSELDENLNLDVDSLAKRINELAIYKEYYYMFSGKNDQIIDFNMRFNEAYALKHPAFGQGDFAQQSQMAIAPALQEKEAKNNKTTNTGASDKVEKQTKPNSILDTLKQLKEAKDGNFSNLLQGFGDYLGFTKQEIADIEGNLNGEKAQLLAQSLADERISDALANNSLVKRVTSPQEGTQTESDNNTDTETTSTSSYIDFLYASELVKGLEGDDLSESDAKNIVKAKLRNAIPKKIKVDTDNKVAEAPGERDSYRPSAFSHLMSVHGEAASNQVINLTLRGDPWYLGMSNFYDNSVGNNAVKGKDQNSSKLVDTNLFSAQWSGGSVDFLVVIESPRKFDFNIDDEDQNTGLYDFSGINYTMSGVYHTIKAVTNFSNGLFTVDVSATKDPAYEMSIIETVKNQINKSYEINRAQPKPDAGETDKSEQTKSDTPVDTRTGLQKGLVYHPITGKRFG